MSRNDAWRTFRKASLVIATIFPGLVPNVPAQAQQCKSAPLCRTGGTLLHANGITTAKCQKEPGDPPSWPNASAQRTDKICRQIGACPAAGGFGKFLQSVTGNCESKQFDGYFGLDGMTFGILDWTSDNLPTIVQAYQQRDKDAFDQLFGKLDLKFKNGCLDPDWVCKNNRQGALVCHGSFREAFAQSLKTAAFQKAQVDHALREYETRLARFSHLGLKTEYGNIALAVVANNLVSKSSCRPDAWKQACAGKPNETELVRCMLERYVDNKCRGSLQGSRRRADAINAVFAGLPESSNIHPTAEAIISCSDQWGVSIDGG